MGRTGEKGLEVPEYLHRSNQLRYALLEEWNNIPMSRMNALMHSTQRKIGAETAEGAHQILISTF